MKRLIIITTILLIAAGYITVAYFKNLNPPGSSTNLVISNIPDNAALILEYADEKSFYDIFAGNTLPAAVIGPQTLTSLETLRKTLVNNTALNDYVDGQNIFISMHPSIGDSTDYLLTIALKKDFAPSVFNEIAAVKNTGMLITPLKINGKNGFTVYLKAVQKRFYMVTKGDNIISGSFSKPLAELSAGYNANKQHEFTLLPAQQNTNALANLYVNYRQFNALFNRFFSYDAGVFKDLRNLAATAVLSLNYKRDALMFNGLTSLNAKQNGYLKLFTHQKTVQNRLKAIFPSTTAHFASYALSDIKRYNAGLSDWHKATPNGNKEPQLINTVQNETGVNLKQDIAAEMANEFAVLTTRYQERFGIIAFKDGARLNNMLASISSPMSDNSGRFNYDKIPYFIFGDAFEIFRKPFFMILDNYLILANSYQELESYRESYIDRKFLVKMENYSRFDNLMSQRSNVSFYVDIENATPVFKRDMRKDLFKVFENKQPGWKDIAGASCQLTASGDGFYTNLCIAGNTENDNEEASANK
ncbi:MAG: hypothetical protein EOP46_05865 [Sphingobacteriaceae bacterium]|nr:MAG: hypothetical protein EOP46_05865 [Sphingobacteriaceae bacterium]